MNHSNETSTMHAAIMRGTHHIEFSERVKPQAQRGEVLLQVKANSVCGSDIHYFKEGGIGTMKVTDSFTPGHEFSGVIVEGTGQAMGLADGTLVAVDPAQPCHICKLCISGRQHLCPNHTFVGGPPTNGAMAEFIAVPASSLHIVPKSFTAQEAALLEPLGIAIHALDLAKLHPASEVVILGAGSIGLYLLLLAQISGSSHTSIIEPLAYRREKALSLGANSVFPNIESYLSSNDGKGVDVVIEATTSPEGPAHATQAAAIGGKVILVGIPDGDKFSLTASLVRRKGLTIKLSRRMGHVYPRAIQLVESGKIDVNSIVTHVMPLAEVQKAFELMSQYQENVIKIVLEP